MRAQAGKRVAAIMRQFGRGFVIGLGFATAWFIMWFMFALFAAYILFRSYR